MTKKKSQPICELSNHVPTSEWSKTREKERIQYPEGAPVRASWKSPGNYTGKELSYRGQQERAKPVFLTGREL